MFVSFSPAASLFGLQDERQELTISKLQQLYEELKERMGGERSLRKGRGLTLLDAAPAAKPSSSGWFSGLFGGREESTAAAVAAPAVRGLYMYGGVGVGKTMLMDLLAKNAPTYFQVPLLTLLRLAAPCRAWCTKGCFDAPGLAFVRPAAQEGAAALPGTLPVLLCCCDSWLARASLLPANAGACLRTSLLPPPSSPGMSPACRCASLLGLPPQLERTHFHDFMIEVHQRLRWGPEGL